MALVGYVSAIRQNSDKVQLLDRYVRGRSQTMQSGHGNSAAGVERLTRGSRDIWGETPWRSAPGYDPVERKHSR